VTASGAVESWEQLADIFISYARADRDLIAALSVALEQSGRSIWWDRHIDGGLAFAQAIESELNAAKVVIVAWSQAASKSDWVKDEAGAARDQGKLVPVSLDGTVGPLGFRQYHAIDLTGWNGDASQPAFRDLLRSLESRLGETTASRVPPTRAASAAPTPGAREGTVRTRSVLIAALMAMTLVGGAFYFLRGNRANEALPATTTIAAVPTASTAAETSLDKSIAVLPFANRSAHPDDAYFAEGMHDDLLSQLAQIGDLRVVSRTSVMRYANTDKPIPEIARELGVGVVLEGGVQRAGDRVRINVQLIDARKDRHLWAETFDRQLTVANLFDIQSEITRAIASELKSVLDAPTKLQSEQLPTQSTEAYNAYLLGNTLNRFEAVSDKMMRQAAEAYGKAVAIDPNFAAAHARKAYTHLVLAWWRVDAAENTRLAEQSLDRARKLAPDSIETRVAEGFYRYWIRYDFAGAAEAARLALEQAPQDLRLLKLRASATRRAGDLAASTAAWERNFALDPRNADAATNLGTNAAFQGKLAEARQWMLRADALSPNLGSNLNLEATILFLSDDPEAAWRGSEARRAQAPPESLSTPVWMISAGFAPERLKILADMLRSERFAGLYELEGAFMRALALEQLGQKDEARALAASLKGPVARQLEQGDDSRRRGFMLAMGIDAFLGDLDAARAKAANLGRNPPYDRLWVLEFGPALLATYAWIGEPERAFDLIEQAMDQYSPVHFLNLKYDIAFDPYRQAPRYKALEARYDKWKATQKQR
jgi:TolB-like protein/Tfp pilus assembly protein PilF